MVLFGGLQLSLLAFTQASQDGAAFVAARAYAQNPAGGASPPKPPRTRSSLTSRSRRSW